jgi:hypothetical protein
VYPLLSGRDFIPMVLNQNQKQYVEDLKVEWQKLWRERTDDKVKAESIAVNDYDALFIDRGTVIHATRDFKPLNFREILEKHDVEGAERYISPNPHIGGWTKFVKDNITNQPSQTKKSVTPEGGAKQKPKPKKNGWLNV